MPWVTPPTFTSGQSAGVSTGLNNMSGNLANLAGAWIAYTPTYSAGGTAITLGNGTIDAAYKIMGDKTVFFRASLLVGSSTTLGTGTFSMTLPVAAKSVHLVGAYITGAAADGTFRNVSTTSVQFYSGGTTQTVATLGLTSGSIIYVNGTYEAA